MKVADEMVAKSLIDVGPNRLDQVVARSYVSSDAADVGLDEGECCAHGTFLLRMRVRTLLRWGFP
jgi:hypothetical protein